MASSPTPFEQLMAACDQAEQLREVETHAWTVGTLSAQVHDAFLTRGEALPLTTCEEAARRVLQPASEAQAVIQLDKPETTPAPTTPAEATPLDDAFPSSPADRRRRAIAVLMMGGAMAGLPLMLNIMASMVAGDSSQADPLTPLIQGFATLGNLLSGVGVAIMALGGLMFLLNAND